MSSDRREEGGGGGGRAKQGQCYAFITVLRIPQRPSEDSPSSITRRICLKVEFAIVPHPHCKQERQVLQPILSYERDGLCNCLLELLTLWVACMMHGANAVQVEYMASHARHPLT